jgi:hypothetical protein
MDFDNASNWVCESPPGYLTQEELAEAARQHTLWCDTCGESR